MPTENFAKCSSAKDGLNWHCRDCASERAKERNARPEVKAQKAAYAVQWRELHPDRYKAGYLKHNKNPKYVERRRVLSAQWEKSEAGKAWRREWKEKNRHVLQAHWAVKQAVISRKLIRPNACQQCGTACAVQAHHHNGYSDEHRLDVRWLCPKCHKAANS